jgi:hypothetical protein
MFDGHAWSNMPGTQVNNQTADRQEKNHEDQRSNPPSQSTPHWKSDPADQEPTVL